MAAARLGDGGAQWWTLFTADRKTESCAGWNSG
ncbi:hypothetical protein HNR22_001680 [Micromonospora jinlongensis]|uniref:Uncharacterized protein n=1 Tax=Micromonospora jinlongensis TaxID=1287877 RepID=A0A7Z0BC74_9ACTN|nr:hypothetical protein [Micromonospora jinlongensis]